MSAHKFKVGGMAKLKKATWASVNGMMCLVDETGPIISIRGKTKGHNNIHKYAIRGIHAIHFTNKPLKP